MPQYSRPIGDFEIVGGFEDAVGGTTNLYTNLDETSLSTADYVSSPRSPGVADTYRMAMGPAADPAISSGHVLRYTLAKNAGGGKRIDVDIRLRDQAGTIFAEFVHPDVQATLTTYTQTLTAQQADAITDYSTLVATFDPTAVGGGAGREVYLYWLEFEVPTPMTIVTVDDQPTFGISEAPSSIAPDPDSATVELWEGGVLKQTLGTIELSGTGEVHSFWWDATVLGDLSGADVELRIVANGSIDIDSVEWNRARALAEEIDKTGNDTVRFGITDTSALVKIDAARESWNSILM